MQKCARCNGKGYIDIYKEKSSEACMPLKKVDH